MSKDFLLTDKDLTVTEQGEILLADTKLELARQWVEVRLQTYLGEWFLDESEGIDWPEILSNRDNQRLVDSTVKTIIVQTQYITNLLSYSSVWDKSTQKYQISFAASVEDGEVLTVNNLEI